MASTTATVVAPSSASTHNLQAVHLSDSTNKSATQDVNTVLHYFKPNADGSPPHPIYVDRPETYERPSDVHPVTVRDVRGLEEDFTLDRNGFQLHKHIASEKDFVDDEKIKSGYYAETEQLLKDV
jgi:hypothetical protein